MSTLTQLQNRLIDYSEHNRGRYIDTDLIEHTDLASALTLYKVFYGDDKLSAQAERELIREAKEVIKKV